MKVHVKSVLLGFVGIGICSLIAGCSTTEGYLGHSICTDVQLNQANYVVLRSVTGTAEASYFFGIGPSEQDLLGCAKRDMIEKAQLIGGSKAVINVTTDIKYKWFLIWHHVKAYVSGEVIEFKR